MRGCSASLTKVMDFDGTVVLGQPVETREVNIRCLIPGLPQAATILAAKLAVIAAAGAGLYVAYQYTDVQRGLELDDVRRVLRFKGDRQRACAGEFLPAASDGRAGLLWESDVAQHLS